MKHRKSIQTETIMKQVSLLAFLLCFTALCFAQDGNKPVLTITKKTYDFGTIKEADGKVTHVFSFTNSGKSPLVIQDVKASCGCTTPTWTKEPVAPGESGEITVTFNPANRPGGFNKQITITNNSGENPVYVTIKGYVTAKNVNQSTSATTTQTSTK
jgi:hypothetical protein